MNVTVVEEMPYVDGLTKLQKKSFDLISAKKSNFINNDLSGKKRVSTMAIELDLSPEENILIVCCDGKIDAWLAELESLKKESKRIDQEGDFQSDSLQRF